MSQSKKRVFPRGRIRKRPDDKYEVSLIISKESVRNLITICIAQDIELDECIARCSRIGCAAFFEREDHLCSVDMTERAEKIVFEASKHARTKSELISIKDIVGDVFGRIIDRGKG